MFDTVNLRLDRAEVSKGNLFELLPYLSEITERQNEKSGYNCSGKIGDYTVNIFDFGVFFNGSLAKYYLGNNIETLTRHEAKAAIEQLSDNLHTDIRLAKVTRFDFSTVIQTKRPPADYYSYFGQKPYFERQQATKNTLYYNNHQRKLIFYDKTKEAGAKGVKMPEIFINNNLLRYELRYTKRINKQFKTDVTASTLTDEVFYKTNIQNWHNEFKTIQKLKSSDFMIDNINSRKEAKEALFAYSLQQLGQSTIDDFLAELKAEKKFSSRSDYTKLKNELNKIVVAKNGNKNELINELEKSIFRTAKYAM